MTDQPLDLDAIQARLDAASRGPWSLSYEYCDCSEDCGHGLYVSRIDTGSGPATELCDLPRAEWELMVHAREDVDALVAEVRRLRADEAIALPASWECAYGPNDGEPFCEEAEGDDHVCTTIRVHPADGKEFAALVDEMHQLRVELATARVDALRALADRADPQHPEVSFFGDHGHEVGAWIRKQAEYEQRRLAAAGSAAANEDGAR